eukprot:scaffold126471_cov27-Tisochrysis_lutea.AAC.2
MCAPVWVCVKRVGVGALWNSRVAVGSWGLARLGCPLLDASGDRPPQILLRSGLLDSVCYIHSAWWPSPQALVGYKQLTL